MNAKSNNCSVINYWPFRIIYQRDSWFWFHNNFDCLPSFRRSTFLSICGFYFDYCYLFKFYFQFASSVLFSSVLRNPFTSKCLIMLDGFMPESIAFLLKWANTLYFKLDQNIMMFFERISLVKWLMIIAMIYF